MSNTVEVTGGKPIAVWPQSISGENAINPTVTSYDIDGRRREVLFWVIETAELSSSSCTS
jgi:hypothetical protein